MHGDELAETAADPAAASGNRPLGPGDAIGRYRVERVLGQGGMGVVYAVHDPDLDRPVALKLLRGTPGDEARTRLLREARAMAKLSHPNVITVYEVGSAGAIDYVAMELIDGKSLAEWLAQSRRSTDDVLRVFRAAARGLLAAHQVGLVHRDFKPANVLVGHGERVVVTDFGLARAFDDVMLADPAQLAAAAQPVAAAVPPGGRPDAASLSSTLTRTGALLGTPAYMAPEQFAGVTAGPRSDQYAFCVALWEALAGGRPFRGATIDELRRQAQAGDAVGADALPRRLRPILARGMARDPADRYPDLGGLVAAIDRAERRPRNLVMAATAGGALVLALATTALWPHGASAPSAARQPACPDPAAELADAWSPAQAGPLAAHLATVPGAWRELSESRDRTAVPSSGWCARRSKHRASSWRTASGAAPWCCIHHASASSISRRARPSTTTARAGSSRLGQRRAAGVESAEYVLARDQRLAAIGLRDAGDQLGLLVLGQLRRLLIGDHDGHRRAVGQAGELGASDRPVVHPGGEDPCHRPPV